MAGKSFLIIAASIGSGHIKAAEAIAEALKNKYPDSRIEIVDFTEWHISGATAFMKKAYLAMLRVVPNLYEVMYKFTGGRAGGISVQNLISAVTRRNVEALVKKFKPDAVICTHPFPAGATAWYKETRKTNFLFGVMITDYSVHQMWIYQGVDCYFVARESMKNDLIAAGLFAEQIHVTGIPIAGKFLRLEPKYLILKRFSLTDTMPVILMMGGGLGLGGVEMALEKLERVEKRLQILVIAGKNEELKQSVDEKVSISHHKIFSWGYCSEVAELMSVADLLITKPGALTITEALVSELPMLLHDPIPGPETDNAVYAARRGAAVWVRSEARLAAVVNELLTEPARLFTMKEMARSFKRPNAAHDIAEKIAAEFLQREKIAEKSE